MLQKDLIKSPKYGAIHYHLKYCIIRKETKKAIHMFVSYRNSPEFSENAK